MRTTRHFPEQSPEDSGDSGGSKVPTWDEHRRLTEVTRWELDHLHSALSEAVHRRRVLEAQNVALRDRVESLEDRLVALEKTLGEHLDLSATYVSRIDGHIGESEVLRSQIRKRLASQPQR